MCKFTISTFQFMQKFRTDESARVFLEKRRWPVECPKSQAKQGISSHNGKRAFSYRATKMVIYHVSSGNGVKVYHCCNYARN